MNTVETLKRLYKDYTKYYIKKIAFAMALSIVIAGSTSAIAYLLDPAIKKIFIDQNAKLIIIIPLLIIFAFTTLLTLFVACYLGNRKASIVFCKIYKTGCRRKMLHS